MINNLASPNNTSTTEYLSVPTLAAISSESEFAWRKRIFKRQIPFVKFGRNVRIRRQDFDAWVAARLIAATAVCRAADKSEPRIVLAQPGGGQ